MVRTETKVANGARSSLISIFPGSVAGRKTSRIKLVNFDGREYQELMAQRRKLAHYLDSFYPEVKKID